MSKLYFLTSPNVESHTTLTVYLSCLWKFHSIHTTCPLPYADLFSLVFFSLSTLEKVDINEIIGQNSEGQKEDLELPLFNLSTIASATDNFSLKNKLGQGGFGAVYRVNA